MHVVAIASQTSGVGRTTFAANLAVLADAPDAPALLIDTDPRGRLAAWHKARDKRTPLVAPCRAGELGEVLDTAARDKSIEWVFVDGPAQANDDVAGMMRAATLVVIPARPGVFGLAAVPAIVALSRRVKRPFFVALNAAPAKRGVVESPIVAAARKAIAGMGAPVWRGAIALRAAHAHALAAGQSATEFDPTGPAAEEMRLLWRDVADAARKMAPRNVAG